MAFLSRASASRPRSPPTSMSVTPRSAFWCGLSEAGMLTTSSVFLAALAASLNAWAKVKCVSNEPAGRSAVVCSCRA